MSEKLGMINYETDSDEVFIGRDLAHARSHSEVTAGTIDAEVKRIIDEAYAQTKETLLSYTERMDFVVERLLDCEVMEGEELKEIMEAKNLDDLRAKYKAEDDEKKEAKKEEDNAEESSDDELEDDEDVNEYPEDPFSFLTKRVHLVDRNKNKDENSKKEDEW